MNVKVDFGAFGDGIHDDTEALQTALDSRDEIFFPKGIYKITACLIFYGEQNLLFENGAVLKRFNPEQKYLLANFTTPEKGEYSSCENVVIDGATFDGNEEIDFKTTMLNTCHAKNIIVKNCRFLNGHTWHYFEINSSQNVKVENCIFESSYGGNSFRGEQIQLDFAKIGNYGPIFNYKNEEIKFNPDNTVCRNIEITNCNFYSYGVAPAIGNHIDAPHHNVKIHRNTFVGNFGERGFVNFVPSMYDVEIKDNFFEN